MDTYTPEQIESLPRKMLQSLAKEHGIKANQKSTALRKALVDLIPSNEDQPALKEQESDQEPDEAMVEEETKSIATDCEAGDVADNVEVPVNDVTDDVVMEEQNAPSTPEEAKCKSRFEWYAEAMELRKENECLKQELSQARAEVKRPRRKSIRAQWQQKDVIIAGTLLSPRAAHKPVDADLQLKKPTQTKNRLKENRPKHNAKKTAKPIKKGGYKAKKYPGVRPSVIGAGCTVAKKRKFDLSASLKRPITWKMNKKPFKYAAKKTPSAVAK